MKYTPPDFNCSDEAISALKQEHNEAKEFLWGYIEEQGLLNCVSGLDFHNIIDVMAQYKNSLKDKTNCSNSNLIESAPDLLEALRNYISWADGFLFILEDKEKTAMDVYYDAKEAISKAMD